uniref:Methyltransferase domain-containing protein n=1 Tax=Pyrodinium bahamense TaxID=73915 RepID=A0A7S0FNK5_9DINO|mmetsp:Transcript_38523/g.107358  ORF Transcript_38523/g.107358 Transcript_38523/m.107358 type:complete len:242 (+) Transcript_38523:38-763(+)
MAKAADGAPPLPSTAPIAAAAAVVAATAAAFGFFVGAWAAARGAPRRSRRRRDEVCECGACLPLACTPEEIERHKTSTRHKRNLLLLSSASEVVVCEEVGEYRAAAQGLVGPDDHVLEVGCHVGGTSKVLAGVAGRLVCLDQQAQLVAQARVNLPDIQFEICDAFDAQRIIALAQSIRPDKFTKVFVDISGSRDLSTVVRLMDIYENTLRPEILVVKSQALKRLLLRSKLWINHPVCTGQV